MSLREISIAKHRVERPRRKWPTPVFLAFIGVLLLTPLVAHAVGGYGVATVLTSSMKPTLLPGDLVITLQTPAKQLETSDLIFLVDGASRQSYVHRIVAIRDDSGRLMIHTKGDANPVVDSAVALLPKTSSVPKTIAVVPYAGAVVAYFTSFEGRALSLALIFLSLLLILGRKATSAISTRRGK
jgi:signal peptidase